MEISVSDGGVDSAYGFRLSASWCIPTQPKVMVISDHYHKPTVNVAK